MPRFPGRAKKRIPGGAWLALLFLLALALFAARSGVDFGGLPVGASPSPAVPGEGAILAYFTAPGRPEALDGAERPGEALASAIRRARKSVDVAVYAFDLWSAREALLDAHRRGLGVRLVVDGDHLVGEEIQALAEAGIAIRGDGREGLMHDKFALIDRFEVWTGSMNFTWRDANESENNLVRIRSARLAENYLAEFEEMFEGGRFGPASPANTPYPVFALDGSRLETYFSPEDGTAARLVQIIRQAQESVCFLAYSFTSAEIAEALLERARAGLQVTGVFDEQQARSNAGAQFERLLEAGLPVRLDGNPGSMHHKVLVIDERIVVTGSYNFSESAEERNDENTLIIHDSAIAALYQAEFERVFAQASIR